MKITIEKSVCVITPTIGQSKLQQAMESVSKQTYQNITHLVVIDGPEYFGDAMKVMSLNTQQSNVQVAVTPYNTGNGGFYGHRIYAAYPHLVNHDYVAFLDEDNWYDPDHIKSMVDKLENMDYDWVYSLRKVYVEDEFLADDCCESIGRWPIWFSQKDPENHQHLVDTSAYLFRRDFLITVASHWHSGWGGDRRFFGIVTKELGHNNYGTTGLHTLNYRLPDMDRAYGGDMIFFERGYGAVKQHYGGKYPWTE